MITSWPTKTRLNLVGFWSFFYRLSFDRKNRSVKPHGKLPRIGSNTGNVFAPCPGYVAVVKLTGYTTTTGYFFLKGCLNYRLNFPSRISRVAKK